MKHQNEQTVWMYPNQIYVVSGGASANSLFLEDIDCHTIFFQYCHRFLGGMAEVLHYKLTATGWAMLIKTKSEKEIKESYFKLRSKSKKANRKKDLNEAKRMLSEHFRIFLSNFAKRCNALLGRSGVWVKRKFDKLWIRNERDYKRQFDLICDLQDCKYDQLKKKYQADQSQYDELKILVDEDGVESVWRSSLGVYENKVSRWELPISLRLVRPESDVLRKIIEKAKNHPPNPKPPPNT